MRLTVSAKSTLYKIEVNERLTIVAVHFTLLLDDNKNIIRIIRK